MESVSVKRTSSAGNATERTIITILSRGKNALDTTGPASEGAADTMSFARIAR